MLFYIQASNVRWYNLIASRVYLPVLYTYSKTELELTVASQNRNWYPEKCMYFANMQLVSKCYTGVS